MIGIPTAAGRRRPGPTTFAFGEHRADGADPVLSPAAPEGLRRPATNTERRCGVGQTGRRVVGFVLAVFTFQIALFFLGGIASVRLPLRIGAYALSLAMLLLIKGRARTHPAFVFAQSAVAILVIELINPGGDSWVARVATVVLYSSVLSPLLWVGRLQLRSTDFRAVLRIMWAFYTLSAAVGVLQIYFPGQFDGSLSANFEDRTAVSFQMHVMQMADGRKIIRPMGLTDVPGGAGTGGVNAIVLGAGLLLTEASLIFRGVVVAGMLAGLFCIYIVQERTNLIVVGLAVASLTTVLVRRGSVRRLATLLSVLAAVTVVSTTLAFTVGGEAISDRFATLVANNPHDVFQANRGQFLQELVHEDVFNYPLGAGQGHWGMVNSYFGNGGTSLWAEMLWQALCYDGGVPLMFAYLGLFACLLWTAWQTATIQHSDIVGTWAGVVLGYNLAAAAASFVFPIMSVQIGMEVIVLNACLYGVAWAEQLPTGWPIDRDPSRTKSAWREMILEPTPQDPNYPTAPAGSPTDRPLPT